MSDRHRQTPLARSVLLVARDPQWRAAAARYIDQRGYSCLVVSDMRRAHDEIAARRLNMVVIAAPPDGEFVRDQADVLRRSGIWVPLYLLDLAAGSPRLRPVTFAAAADPVLAVDAVERHATVDGHGVDLTWMEHRLARALFDAGGAPLTRDEIHERVWGQPLPSGSRAVDVLVRRLRAKLNGHGELVETVAGVGYRLRVTARS